MRTRAGLQGEGVLVGRRRPAGAPRGAFSPLRLIFITRISLVFFCFPHTSPRRTQAGGSRIIHLYEVTNAIDFFNEATLFLPPSPNITGNVISVELCKKLATFIWAFRMFMFQIITE